MSSQACLIAHLNHSLVNVTLTGRVVDANKIELLSVRLGTFTKVHKKNKHPGMMEIAEDVQAFLDAKIYTLKDVRCYFDGYTDFQRNVLETARSIPWGRVVSYTELARMSGHPNAIRAVASVMRNNRFPLIIPCHRVIRSDGSIGGYGGKSNGKMVALKRRLLEREGVEFSAL